MNIWEIKMTDTPRTDKLVWLVPISQSGRKSRMRAHLMPAKPATIGNDYTACGQLTATQFALPAKGVQRCARCAAKEKNA
jgi:hypothetical protein